VCSDFVEGKGPFCWDKTIKMMTICVMRKLLGGCSPISVNCTQFLGQLFSGHDVAFNFLC